MQIIDDMALEGLITYIIVSHNLWFNPLHASVAYVRKDFTLITFCNILLHSNDD